MCAMRPSSLPAASSRVPCTYHVVCWNFAPTPRAPRTTRRFRRTRPSSSTTGRAVARRWSARPSMTSVIDRFSMPAGSRNWRTPAWRRNQRNSVVDDGDCLDLEHRLGIGEAADLDRRAGRGGRAEIAHPHVGVLGELLVIGDVGIGFDDVGQGSAGRFEAGLDVFANLQDLGPHVAFADANPLRVARQLAGDENHLAGAADGDDLGVSRLAVDHPDMDALRLNLLSFDRHPIPFPYNAVSMVSRERGSDEPDYTPARDFSAALSPNGGESNGLPRP